MGKPSTRCAPTAWPRLETFDGGGTGDGGESYPDRTRFVSGLVPQRSRFAIPADADAGILHRRPRPATMNGRAHWNWPPSTQPHYGARFKAIRRDVTGADGMRSRQGLTAHLRERGMRPAATAALTSSPPVYRLMTRLAREQRATHTRGPAKHERRHLLWMSARPGPDPTPAVAAPPGSWHRVCGRRFRIFDCPRTARSGSSTYELLSNFRRAAIGCSSRARQDILDTRPLGNDTGHRSQVAPRPRSRSFGCLRRRRASSRMMPADSGCRRP
jgi:hypothetical protein